MTSSSLIKIGVVAAALLLGFLADRMRWKRKPLSDLLGMAGGTDWRRWKGALAELRRRGENMEQFVPRLLQSLVADSRMEREAARITLHEFFPAVRAQLGRYSSSNDVAASREELKSLFAEYNVESSLQSDKSR